MQRQRSPHVPPLAQRRYMCPTENKRGPSKSFAGKFYTKPRLNFGPAIAGIDHPQLSVQMIKQLAKDNLAEMPIAKATNAARYRRAEAKAVRDAERALLAGKNIDTWKAKQRQMVAHAFAEEAQRLSDTFDRSTKRWRVTAKSATRSGTAQPFLDQVHGILDRLGMSVKRDPGELGRGQASKPLG